MIYAYQCEKCSTGFTVRATLAEKERGLDPRCPKCGEKDVTQDLRGVGLGVGGQRGGPVLRLRTRQRVLLRMSGPAGAIPVCIVTAPDASCGGATWSGAVEMIRAKLARRFGDAARVEHVLLFSPRFFEMPEVAAAIEAGTQPPIVLVGDVIVSRGGKLSEARIAEALRAAGVNEHRGDPS